MQENNNASPMSQSQRRALRQGAENQIDFIDDQIDEYKDAKDERAVKAEITRLEGEKQKAQDRLDRDSEEDRQRGGAGQDASKSSGDGMPSFEERESAPGLNDTMPGRGQDDPTMDEREGAAGLSGTTSGSATRPSVTTSGREGQTRGDDSDTGVPQENDDDSFGTFGVVICINGRPHAASIYGQLGPEIIQD